jgi:hypothetical protein
LVIDTKKIEGFDMQGYMPSGNPEWGGDSPHWMAFTYPRVYLLHSGD